MTESPKPWDWGLWDDVPGTPVEDELDLRVVACDPRVLPQAITDLEEQIAAVEQDLASLRLVRLQMLADNALIKKLPDEVLSRVFELATHERNDLPAILSLVSRHWRSLALLTPSIWSYIRLDRDWSYVELQESRFINKIRTCLERSREAKLLVDLDLRYCETMEDAREIFTLLKPHLWRCFSFRVNAMDWDWMGVVKDFCQKELTSSVEEVSLRVDPGNDSEDSPPIAVLEGDFTRLSRLTFEQTALTCVKGMMPDLRSFNIASDKRYRSASRMQVTLKDLLTALSFAPSLTEIRLHYVAFHVDGTESFFFNDPDTVCLPNVTDISMHSMESTNISLFIDSVNLPSLRRFTIQSPPDDTIQWLSHLANGCLDRFPCLQQLHMRHCNLNSPSLALFIRAMHDMPQITALALSPPPQSSAIGTKIFDMLAGGPVVTGRWLLPNLQALCLQDCRDVSGHELLRVLQARQADIEVRPISNLRIMTYFHFDEDVLDSLRNAVAVLQLG